MAKVLLRYFIPSVTGCLGWWQYERLKWKLDLLEKRQNCVQRDAIPCTDIKSITKEGNLSQISIKGHIPANAKPVLVGPMGHGDIRGEQAFSYQLVFPFTLSNSSETILLDIGRIDAMKEIPSIDEFEFIGKEIEIPAALLEGGELMGGAGAKTITTSRAKYDSKKRIISKKDNQQLQRILGSTTETSLRCQLRLHPSIKEYPLALPEPSNRHMEYIITWYSLAVCSFAMSFAGKRRKF